MQYAFRVFAAVYNYRVVKNPDQETTNFFYGPAPSVEGEGSHAVWIPARYSSQSRPRLATRPCKERYADEDFYLFHGLDPVTKRPDWLGEIFGWLSSSHERGISKRDAVGRIPDSEMIFSRSDLRPWKPHAALLMSWLENFWRNRGRKEALPRAPSPTAEADHLVVCSHDVDFYFTNQRTALQRLLKNLAIAGLIYKSRSYFRSNLTMILRLLAGKRVGDYLPDLLDRMERLGSRSTLFVVTVHSHRRDPNYRLQELAFPIRSALTRGFSIELHGSYSSVLEKGTLEPERKLLEQVTGKRTLGSRQHWLRFDDSEKLFQAVEAAHLTFDSSMGFTNTVGFRNGACFAYPPYDFKNEKPHNFLEIPLAILDGSLIAPALESGEPPQAIAARVLDESRKRGWGGISILWHNPLEALSVPEEINQIFWKLAKDQEKHHEKWVSSDQFLSLCLQRYQRAGLLTELRTAT